MASGKKNRFFPIKSVSPNVIFTKILGKKRLFASRTLIRSNKQNEDPKRQKYVLQRADDYPQNAILQTDSRISKISDPKTHLRITQLTWNNSSEPRPDCVPGIAKIYQSKRSCKRKIKENERRGTRVRQRFQSN